MAHTAAITKAVVPVAGLGTRFLPASKAIPKVMLPVVDKPAVQYVVEEAAAAGLLDVIFVTGAGQAPIGEHFSPAPDLEGQLAAKGNEQALSDVRAAAALARVSFARQDAPRGLGHAVLCAADQVGDEPFVVMLGDDLIDQRDGLLETMIGARRRYGGTIVALMEVDPAEVSAYGCAAIKPTDTPDLVVVTDLVEKPDRADAPSNWIVIGRYVCDPAIFDVLRQTPPGRGGEIQLTDALRALAVADQGHAADAGGVRGVLFRGRRYDTGNKLDFLKTTVQFACDRADLAPEFVPWLREYLRSLP
jgi:UTP--glucose-1-phosphate uridylyltransferase